MQIARFNRILIAALVIAGLSGCGRSIKVVAVKGRVTFNGNPVDKAEVCFIREAGTPKGEPAPPAIAVTAEDGTFSLITDNRSGAVPGHYRVTVQKTNFHDLKIPKPLPKPYRGEKDIMAYMVANNLVVYPLLPEKYADMRNSPLTADVVTDSSKNKFELALEGEPPPQTAAQTP